VNYAQDITQERTQGTGDAMNADKLNLSTEEVEALREIVRERVQAKRAAAAEVLAAAAKAEEERKRAEEQLEAWLKNPAVLARMENARRSHEAIVRTVLG
jgi:hypothetical protein